MKQYPNILKIAEHVDEIRNDVLRYMEEYPVGITTLARKMSMNYLTLLRFLEKRTVPKMHNLLKMATYLEGSGFYELKLPKEDLTYVKKNQSYNKEKEPAKPKVHKHYYRNPHDRHYY